MHLLHVGPILTAQILKQNALDVGRICIICAYRPGGIAALNRFMRAAEIAADYAPLLSANIIYCQTKAYGRKGTLQAAQRTAMYACKEANVRQLGTLQPGGGYTNLTVPRPVRPTTASPGPVVRRRPAANPL